MPKVTAELKDKEAETNQPILLDTHVAIWLASGSSRLKAPILSLIEDSFGRGTLYVSAVSAWEIGILVARKRLDLGLSPIAWFADFVNQFSVVIADITPEIAINSSFIPGPFHGDPADRMLIATARAYSAAIVTADKDIIAFGKRGFVKVVGC